MTLALGFLGGPVKQERGVSSVGTRRQVCGHSTWMRALRERRQRMERGATPPGASAGRRDHCRLTPEYEDFIK